MQIIKWDRNKINKWDRNNSITDLIESFFFINMSLTTIANNFTLFSNTQP